jgi:hypothetical protein
VDTIVGGLAVAAGFALLLAFYWWLARRIRRAGIGGGLMGPLDEAWNPGRHKYREVVEVQEQRMEPVEAQGGRRLSLQARRGQPLDELALGEHEHREHRQGGQ